MVDELHKMGYEKLRICPGLIYSGSCWRCEISPKCYVGCDSGAKLCYNVPDNIPVFLLNKFKDNSNPKELARLFVDEYPEICRMSEGCDADYMKWFDMVMKLAEKEQVLPYCYSEGGGCGWGMIPFTNSEYAIPFASFGESSDSDGKMLGISSKFVFTAEELKDRSHFYAHQDSLCRSLVNGLVRRSIDNNIDFLFFRGHYSKSCLSQWFPSKFKICGITYNYAEQFVMAEKARVFGDEKTRKMILNTSDPQEIKSLDRGLKGFDAYAWNEISDIAVEYCNMAKFSQNRDLLEYLIGTGDKVIVDASPLDTMWGIGMNENDPNIMDVSKWKGLNKLGFALMEVREWMVKYKNTLDVIGC